MKTINLEEFGILIENDSIIILKPVGRKLKINKRFYQKNNSYFQFKNEEQNIERLKNIIEKYSKEDFKENVHIYLNSVLSNRHILNKEEIKPLNNLLKNIEFNKEKSLFIKNLFNIHIEFHIFEEIIESNNIKNINFQNFDKSKMFEKFDLEDKRKFLQKYIKMEETKINNYIMNYYLN